MASTTATLSNLMQTFYDRLFVDMAKHTLIWEQGAQMRPVPSSQGEVVYFQRYTPLAIITAETTEGSNPSAVNLSATNVSTTLSEFGSYTSISKKLKLTSVDSKMKGSVEVMATNAGESRDQMVREKAYATATAQYAGAGAALTDVAITDTMSANELRLAVRSLKVAKAQRYEDGFFLGKMGPYAAYDLMGDSTWVNAHTYKDGMALYRGEAGKLHGVRVVETTNWKETVNGGASSADLVHSYVHGKNAVGVTDLDGDSQKIYVKTPGAHSTDNPVDRFYTVGWAETMSAVSLVSDWIVEVISGATGQS